MKNTYKKTAVIIGLFAALIVRSIAASPEAEAHFVADAKAAFDTKDSSKLLSLVCWDGVTPEFKTMLTQQYSGMVQQPISKVELVAPDPKQKTEFTLNGVTYHFNLAVIKQLKITIVTKPGDSASAAIPVGEKDGKLFITTTAPVKCCLTPRWSQRRLLLHFTFHRKSTLAVIRAVAQLWIVRQHLHAMRLIIFYLLVLLIGILPVILRRAYWLRVVCVLLLGFFAFFWCGFYMLFEPHYVADIAQKQNGGLNPTDFHSALTIIGQVSQHQMTTFAFLFAGFFILALFPYRRLDDRKETHAA